MARKFITICLALGLALAAASEAVAAPQSARDAGAIPAAASGLVVRGAGFGTPGGSDGVRAIQRRLTELGFRPGPVDGLFGARTEQAVLAFQRTHGLSVDGIVGPQTRTHLRYHGTRPFAGLGSGYSRPGGSSLVREIQHRLRAFGFRPGPVDGLFGPRTERAVRTFQKSRGLVGDGLVRGETLRQLRGNVAQEASEPAPERPRSDEASVSRADDAPPVERRPSSTAASRSTDGSADTSIVSVFLVAFLGAIAGIVVLLAARGIGRALARKLVALGSHVRSAGLASGPSPFEAGRDDARRPRSARAVPPTRGGREHEGPARPVLTDRELAVLKLAAEGFTNAQIGDRLYLSRHTVKGHLSNAMRKLGAANRLRAISEATSLGLLGENGLSAPTRGDPAAEFAFDDLANGTRTPDLGMPSGTKEEP
jgi:peptidoglycan hydrolase-like protein with peptidoglycan-binding domain/DNA-binding CsgD family transcriptional regulator